MHTTQPSSRYLIPFAALSLFLVAPRSADAQAATSPPAAEAAAVTKDLPVTPDERQRLVGTYLLSAPGAPGRSMPFRVFEEQGALYGQPQGGIAMRLLYQGDHAFRPEKDLDSRVTFRFEDGQVTGFSVSTPQGDLEGLRVRTDQP